MLIYFIHIIYFLPSFLDCETSFCWFMKKSDSCTVEAPYPTAHDKIEDTSRTQSTLINPNVFEGFTYESGKMLIIDTIERTNTPALTDSSDDASVKSNVAAEVIVKPRRSKDRLSKGKILNGISQLLRGLLQS